MLLDVLNIISTITMGTKHTLEQKTTAYTRNIHLSKDLPIQLAKDISNACFVCELSYYGNLDAINNKLHSGLTKQLHSVKAIGCSTVSQQHFLWGLADNNTHIFAFSVTSKEKVEKVVMASLQKSPLEGSTHKGLQQQVDEVPLTVILNILQEKDSRVILTGHSLGGAVATLIGIKLIRGFETFSSDFNRLQIITFGSPSSVDLEMHSSREMAQYFPPHCHRWRLCTPLDSCWI